MADRRRARSRNNLVVTVCRGGRCGGPKHPEFDHPAQIESLRDAIGDAAGASVRVGECLAMCSASNVVVVRAGRDVTYFGHMADIEATEALCAWLADRTDTLPAYLEEHVVDPANEFEQPGDGTGT